MKNFFAFVGVLVVLLIGVGIWQNWFKFAINSDNKVTVEMDGKKAGEDVKEGWDKVKEKAEELKKKEGATPSTEKTPTTGGKVADTPGPLFGGK